MLVGVRARDFYTEIIHSGSPAVPTVSDVDTTTAAAASAPSSDSGKHLFIRLTSTL
jgi:hypothetical protein